MHPTADAARRAIERHPEVVAAWLFGSVARGTDRADSDVDVAILRGRTQEATLDDLPVALVRDLETEIGRPVDVVVLDDADVDLVHRVLRDGTLLVERDRRARIAFEVKSRHEYFDLLPRVRAYRRAQLARVRNDA